MRDIGEELEGRSVEQRHRPRPPSGRTLNLGGEARDDESMRRKLLQIAELLHVTVRDFAPGLVTFPDDGGVVCLLPALARMHKRRVPSPTVDAGNANAARGEVERRLTSHAATGREILVGADAGAGTRIHQYNVEWLEFVPDAREFRLHLRRAH